MTPLRIALIASNRYPIRQPFAGGLEAHVWHLAHALGKDGHEVTLFAAPGFDPELPASFLAVPSVEVSDLARSAVSMPPSLIALTTFSRVAPSTAGRESRKE